MKINLFVENCYCCWRCLVRLSIGLFGLNDTVFGCFWQLIARAGKSMTFSAFINVRRLRLKFEVDFSEPLSCFEWFSTDFQCCYNKISTLNCTETEWVSSQIFRKTLESKMRNEVHLTLYRWIQMRHTQLDPLPFVFATLYDDSDQASKQASNRANKGLRSLFESVCYAYVCVSLYCLSLHSSNGILSIGQNSIPNFSLWLSFALSLLLLVHSHISSPLNVP